MRISCSDMVALYKFSGMTEFLRAIVGYEIEYITTHDGNLYLTLEMADKFANARNQEFDERIISVIAEMRNEKAAYESMKNERILGITKD